MDELKVDKRTQNRAKAEVERKARALERLTVEYVPIDSIKPNAYNPNRQTDQDFSLLIRSMKEDGFTQPVVVQRETREIVDGEHRWRAARHLGLAEVPIVLVDMTAEQMRISTLRHNRARGSEDVELGAQLLRDLRELGALEWAVDSLMLDDRELDRLMSDVPVPEQLAGEDYVEAWAPTRNPVQTEGLKPRENEQTSMSPAYEKAAEAFKARVDATTSQAEKAKVEFEMRKATYRVVVVFTHEEAALVRGVLEPRPAHKLLELCRRKLAAVAAGGSAP